MSKVANGWIAGFIGVLIFSGSLPATRVAVMGFDPVFLTLVRASIAGLLALCILLVSREKRPARADLFPLLLVAIGVVVGFPLLTALALQYITAAHSIVFIGLLPLATLVITQNSVFAVCDSYSSIKYQNERKHEITKNAVFSSFFTQKLAFYCFFASFILLIFQQQYFWGMTSSNSPFWRTTCWRKTTPNFLALRCTG